MLCRVENPRSCLSVAMLGLLYYVLEHSQRLQFPQISVVRVSLDSGHEMLRLVNGKPASLVPVWLVAVLALYLSWLDQRSRKLEASQSPVLRVSHRAN